MRLQAYKTRIIEISDSALMRGAIVAQLDVSFTCSFSDLSERFDLSQR